jgi:hypothetical protein
VLIGELQEKVRRWDQEVSSDPARYASILNELDYRATRGALDYLPAQHSDHKAQFMDRLADWVGNVTDDSEQKLLLEYARYISFFSHDDFAALYSAAFSRQIVQWVAARTGAGLNVGGAAGFHAAVHRELHRHTLFCPISDSMDINEFYKVNHITGASHRPAFLTLHMLAEKRQPDPLIRTNILSYMANPTQKIDATALKRLVLLEDVVGSGKQCIDAIRWAMTLGCEVLFVPLILCPNGAEELRALEATFVDKFFLRPVVELKREDLLGPERKAVAGWPIAAQVEAFAEAYDQAVGGSPFGFDDTGCSIVTFANTPDNTLPLVHRLRVNRWRPLFPRVFRGD